MQKIKSVLQQHFNIRCTELTQIHGGLSAANYQVKTTAQSFFLKVYDKQKTQTSLWSENIDSYMPILKWLNENTALYGRIVRPFISCILFDTLSARQRESELQFLSSCCDSLEDLFFTL